METKKESKREQWKLRQRKRAIETKEEKTMETKEER